MIPLSEEYYIKAPNIRDKNKKDKISPLMGTGKKIEAIAAATNSNNPNTKKDPEDLVGDNVSFSPPKRMESEKDKKKKRIKVFNQPSNQEDSGLTGSSVGG